MGGFGSSRSLIMYFYHLAWDNMIQGIVNNNFSKANIRDYSNLVRNISNNSYLNTDKAIALARLPIKNHAPLATGRATSESGGETSKILLGPYLAGLIEGDGTIAVHEKNSTASKYRPMIIIVFKTADLPLAKYLQKLTNCGNVQLKDKRGYVLWQIGAIAEVYTIVNIINGYFRTPKIEALNRTIDWINEYIDNNQNSKLPSTISILSNIEKIEKKSIDNSTIDSNPWLSGFSDSDSNFSIKITKRKNGSPRVQLYYRLEIRQTYHRNDTDEVSFFPIMSKIGLFLGSNVLSRSRILGEKKFFSFIATAFSKNSINQITDYFNKYPLLSSKRLDYQSWCKVLELQRVNSITTSYIEEALEIRKNFNKTRTTYNWNHLNKSYLE